MSIRIKQFQNNQDNVIKILDQDEQTVSKTPENDLNHQQTGQQIPFTITFGREQKQLFNQLFNTPQTQIHSTRGNLPSNKEFQSCPKTSSSHRKIQSTQLSRNSISKNQLQDVKQQISRISYSIKTIQSRKDEQIGVSTKRVLMGTKQLQYQKAKLASICLRRTRCQSSLGFGAPQHNQFQQADQHYETGRFGEAISNNKFVSKRLNVLVRRKSCFGINKENHTNSKAHFMFFQNNPEANNFAKPSKQNQQNAFGCNKVSIRNKISQKENFINPKLKYEKFLLRKQSKKGSGQKIQNDQQVTNKISLPEPTSKNVQVKKKLFSLSNLISQYHTEITQSSQNIMIERSNICQPLKEILRAKFSTISKISNERSGQKSDKNILFRMKMRRKKQEMKCNGSQNDNQNTHFRRYSEQQKEIV